MKGYVDLNLPSGNLWAKENEKIFFDHNDAVEYFGCELPSKEDWDELIDNTWHRWDKNLQGVWFCSLTDANKKIFIPAAGYRNDTDIHDVGMKGYYWSSTSGYNDDDYLTYYAYFVYFYADDPHPECCKGYSDYRYDGHSVRLIKRK